MPYLPLPTTVMPCKLIRRTLASELVFSDSRNCLSPAASQLGSCPSSIEPSLTPMEGAPRGRERRSESSASCSVAVGCLWFGTNRGSPSGREPPVKRSCCGYGRSFKRPSLTLLLDTASLSPNLAQLAVISPAPAAEVNKNSRRFIYGNYSSHFG